MLSHSNSSYDWFALIDCRIIRMFPSCSAEEHFSSWQDHLRAEPPVEWASWWSRCLRRLLRWIWSRCILHCRMNLSRYKNLHWTSRYLMGKSLTSLILYSAIPTKSRGVSPLGASPWPLSVLILISIVEADRVEAGVEGGGQVGVGAGESPPGPALTQVWKVILESRTTGDLGVQNLYQK